MNWQNLTRAGSAAFSTRTTQLHHWLTVSQHVSASAAFSTIQQLNYITDSQFLDGAQWSPEFTGVDKQIPVLQQWHGAFNSVMTSTTIESTQRVQTSTSPTGTDSLSLPNMAGWVIGRSIKKPLKWWQSPAGHAILVYNWAKQRLKFSQVADHIKLRQTSSKHFKKFINNFMSISHGTDRQTDRQTNKHK